MFVLFKDPKYNILGARRVFLAVSALAVVAGLYACFSLWKGTANLGTDFGGGVLLHLAVKQDVSMENMRQSLDKGGWNDAQIQKVGEKGIAGQKWVVRIRRALDEQVGTLGSQVAESLNTSIPDAGVVLEGSEEVGPAVSAKLREDALKAFLISLFGILIYIAFRFDFKFGVISVIATIHDIFFTLAVVV